MKAAVKSRLLKGAAVAALLCLVIYLVWEPGAPKGSYKEMYELSTTGGVEKVEISPKSITWTGTDGSVVKTANPGSPTLYEHLLMHDVSVTSTSGAEEKITLVLDILFYGVFAAIFATVFAKVISPNTFKSVRKTGVTFENIVGMDGIKKDLLQVADIMKHPADYRKKGIRLPKGILLEGGPGNGKTLFARALAGEAGVSFIPAKATDFESMFMAIGPMKVKMLFKKARRQAPCIVFIDEFDGIGTKRNYSGSAIETENTRIVTALLNELDGFTPHDGVLVVAATNSRAALDEALIRPGRFDAHYHIPQPDKATRTALAAMYLQNKSYDTSVTPEKIADITGGASCALVESILNRAPLIAAQRGETQFTLKDVSAALAET